MATCILFAVCQVVGWGPATFLKSFWTTTRGWLCVCSILSSFFLAWSVVVNLPNNGVSLHLQKLFDLNCFIWFAVLGLASVSCRCLGNFGCCCFLIFWFRDWGWALSPYKNSLNLDYCSILLIYLRLGVHGFDEFYGLHGCEIVGWVSEKSGCLWFPGWLFQSLQVLFVLKLPLFIVAMVGLFCNHNYLLLTCRIMYLGGCHISLFRWVLKWWRVPLVCSGVICLCDGKLDVLYFAVKWWTILLLRYLDLLAERWWAIFERS